MKYETKKRGWYASHSFPLRALILRVKYMHLVSGPRWQKNENFQGIRPILMDLLSANDECFLLWSRESEKDGFAYLRRLVE